MRDGGQIVNHLFTTHIGIDHYVAKRLNLEHAFIGNIAAFNGVTDATTAHHAKISTGARHLRRQ
ncbi:hypothetical protein D3C73_1385600 [compost metagenome]